MLVLLFDTVEPYVYETIPIMFFPNGFIYEARFKKRHIQPELVREVESKQTRTLTRPGESILIGLRAVLPNQPGSNPDVYHLHNQLGKANVVPMRLAEIVSVNEVADFVLIRYRMAQFFSAGFVGPRFTDDTACRQVNLDLYERSKLNKRGELFHLFQSNAFSAAARISDIPTLDADGSFDSLAGQDNHWRNVVSKCFFMPFVHALPFLFFMGVRRIGKQGQRRKIREDVTGSLILDSNATYEFKVLEAYPHELHDLKKLDGEVVQELVKESPSRRYSIGLDDNFFTKSFKQRAIGGYDFLEFSAPVRPGTHGNSGVIRFMMDDWSSGDANFISDQLTLEYKVRVGRRRFFFFGGLAVLVVLVVISGLQESWVESLAATWGVRTALLDFVVGFLTGTLYAMGMAGVVTFLVGNTK